VEPADEFLRLLGIMKTLRGTGGCPWDREQTHDSLKSYCIEEAYEVVDAIDRKDVKGLQGELGDLLLQIVFHAQMAKESGTFTIREVLEGINDKLVHRHPHVFRRRRDDRDAKADTAREVVDKWARIKREEGRESVLEGIPKSLPALFRATQMGQKAKSVGFDWEDLSGVWKKVEEELSELKKAKKDPGRAEEELGDLLFTLVNLSRHMGVDAETCLRKAADKFESRFIRMEKESRASGKELSDLSPAELDALWSRAKSGGSSPISS
jgi:tetrapyrrole methylase family protein / MazG family protein